MNADRDEVDGKEVKALAADESALAPLESVTEIEASQQSTDDQQVVAKKTETEEVIQCEEQNEDIEELEVQVVEQLIVDQIIDKPETDNESENLDDSIVAGAPDQAPLSDQTQDLITEQSKE